MDVLRIQIAAKAAQKKKEISSIACSPATSPSSISSPTSPQLTSPSGSTNSAFSVSWPFSAGRE